MMRSNVIAFKPFVVCWFPLINKGSHIWLPCRQIDKDCPFTAFAREVGISPKQSRNALIKAYSVDEAARCVDWMRERLDMDRIKQFAM
jgi:hypothetical protein